MNNNTGVGGNNLPMTNAMPEQTMDTNVQQEYETIKKIVIKYYTLLLAKGFAEKNIDSSLFI